MMTNIERFKRWLDYHGKWDEYVKHSDLCESEDKNETTDMKKYENKEEVEVKEPPTGEVEYETNDKPHNEVVPKTLDSHCTLENILGFYIAVTGENHVVTGEQKDFLNKIVDLSNSWGG